MQKKRGRNTTFKLSDSMKSRGWSAPLSAQRTGLDILQSEFREPQILLLQYKATEDQTLESGIFVNYTVQ